VKIPATCSFAVQGAVRGNTRTKPAPDKSVPKAPTGRMTSDACIQCTIVHSVVGHTKTWENFPNGGGMGHLHSRFLENASTLNPNERSRCANERLWQSLCETQEPPHFLQHNVEFCFPNPSKSNQKQARQLIASAALLRCSNGTNCFRVNLFLEPTETLSNIG